MVSEPVVEELPWKISKKPYLTVEVVVVVELADQVAQEEVVPVNLQRESQGLDEKRVMLLLVTPPWEIHSLGGAMVEQGSPVA